MDPEEIIPLIDTPAVSGVPVDPGMTGSMIMGNNTENTIAGEGTVTFDIFFNVLAPEDCSIGEYQKMYVDVEAQKDASPGNWSEAILQRGVNLGTEQGVTNQMERIKNAI